MTTIRIITLAILLIAAILSAFQREYLSLGVLFAVALVIVVTHVIDKQFPRGQKH